MTRAVPWTPFLLAALCFTVLLWLFEHSKPVILVNVVKDPALAEMSRIIQEQRKTIQILTETSKLIPRCPNDESRIKYPRKASDELTDIVMATSDECGDAAVIDAVIIVHTSADHFRRRHRFRNAYANYNNTKPYRLKVVFLVGSTLNASLQIELELENRQFGDTVVGSFLDTYQNLTLKAVMGFRWLAETCTDIKLLIKMDDDVFFDVHKFFTNFWQKLGSDHKKSSIFCLVWHNAQVGRSGKWKVEKDLFAKASYPFPYCAGFFTLVTPDLIRPMYTQGKNLDFFWIDDVFLYGMVPAAIKGVRFVQLGKNGGVLTPQYNEYRRCREQAGRDKCPYWVALTDGEAEFDREYQILLSSRSTAAPTSSTTVASLKSTNSAQNSVHNRVNPASQESYANLTIRLKSSVKPVNTGKTE